MDSKAVHELFSQQQPIVSFTHPSEYTLESDSLFANIGKNVRSFYRSTFPKKLEEGQIHVKVYHHFGVYYVCLYTALPTLEDKHVIFLIDVLHHISRCKTNKIVVCATEIKENISVQKIDVSNVLEKVRNIILIRKEFEILYLTSVDTIAPKWMSMTPVTTTKNVDVYVSHSLNKERRACGAITTSYSIDISFAHGVYEALLYRGDKILERFDFPYEKIFAKEVKEGDRLILRGLFSDYDCVLSPKSRLPEGYSTFPIPQLFRYAERLNIPYKNSNFNVDQLLKTLALGYGVKGQVGAHLELALTNIPSLPSEYCHAIHDVTKLRSKLSQIKTVGICGCKGAGKTTLCQDVFNVEIVGEELGSTFVPRVYSSEKLSDVMIVDFPSTNDSNSVAAQLAIDEMALCDCFVLLVCCSGKFGRVDVEADLCHVIGYNKPVLICLTRLDKKDGHDISEKAFAELRENFIDTYSHNEPTVASYFKSHPENIILTSFKKTTQPHHIIKLVSQERRDNPEGKAWKIYYDSRMVMYQDSELYYIQKDKRPYIKGGEVIIEWIQNTIVS